MSAYTPGQWDVVPEKPNFRIHSRGSLTRRKRYVAFVAAKDHVDPECIANANLISASPDMYEALKEVLPILESMDSAREDDDEPIPVIAQVKAAMQKAEGREA